MTEITITKSDKDVEVLTASQLKMGDWFEILPGKHSFDSFIGELMLMNYAGIIHMRVPMRVPMGVPNDIWAKNPGNCFDRPCDLLKRTDTWKDVPVRKVSKVNITYECD